MNTAERDTNVGYVLERPVIHQLEWISQGLFCQLCRICSFPIEHVLRYIHVTPLAGTASLFRSKVFFKFHPGLDF
jgi:hypothetical protein